MQSIQEGVQASEEQGHRRAGCSDEGTESVSESVSESWGAIRHGVDLGSRDLEEIFVIVH